MKTFSKITILLAALLFIATTNNGFSGYTPPFAFYWASGNGNWDFATMNWKDTPASGVTNVFYTNNAPVVLDDSAGGTGNILVTNAAPVSPQSVLVDVTANSYTISGSAITGSATLTKNGAGALTLSGSNSFSGGLTLNAGTNNINHANALGSGTLTINGGYIGNTSGVSISNANNNAHIWNSNFTFAGSAALNLGTGAVTITTNIAISGPSSALVVGGNISGTGSLSHSGNSSLALSGVLSFSGGLTNTGGWLTNSGLNTYPGMTALTGGTNVFNSIANVGLPSALGQPMTVADGVITVNSTIRYNGSTDCTSDRVFNWQGGTFFNDSLTGKLILTGGFNNSNNSGIVFRGPGTNIVNGLINIGSGGVSHVDGGLVIFTNQLNQFSGNINISDGYFYIDTIANSGVACSIGTGTSITLGQLNGPTVGKLQLAVTNGSLCNRAITISSQNILSGGLIENTLPGTTVTFSGNITSMITNTLMGPTLTLTGVGNGILSGVLGINTNPVVTMSINKLGTGTWTISGLNTNRGIVTVTNGTLLINGDSSRATNTVTVASGATFGGNGTNGGSVTLNAGGMLLPGGLNTVGTLTLTNNLTLNGGTLYFDLGNVASTSDQVVVGNALNVNGANNIVLSFPNGLAPAGTYTLMTMASTVGVGTFALPGFTNAILNVTATSVQLYVGTGGTYANNLTWKGNVSGTWDTSTGNWVNNGLAGAVYANGLAVTFDDTLTANPVVSGGAVSPCTVTFNNNLTNYTISTAIGGTGTTLTKGGSATATLTGANTYTSNTLVNAGTLVVTNGGAIYSPNATLNIGSGSTRATVSLAAGSTITVQQLLATNVIRGGLTNSILNLSGGTLVTSNVVTTIAANIYVASNASFNINSSWTMNGGTNYIVPVNTNNLFGTIYIGNGVNNAVVTVNSNAVFSTQNPWNMNANTATNMTINIGNGNGFGGSQLIVTNGGRVIARSGPNNGSISINLGGVGNSGNNIIIAGTDGFGKKAVLDLAGINTGVNGNRLNIGGNVLNTTNNWVLVGAGGVITNVNLYVYNGYTNGLIITNGGQVYAFGVVIGRTGTGNYLNVGGADSVGTRSLLSGIPGGATYDLWIGGSGTGLGNQSTNSSVNIGQNGCVTNVNRVMVGPDTNSFGNYLAIANGGQLFSVTASMIGACSNANNNSVSIGGSFGPTNALWNLSGKSLTIGGTNWSTNNFVTLNTGGLLTNVSTIWMGGANTLLTFNGGTLAASTNGMLIATNAGTVSATNYVQAGGAVIDTGVFILTNGLPMMEDPSSTGGGLTKLGAGTLVLTNVNTYTGNTIVSAGKLLVTTAGSSAGSAVTVLAGATNYVQVLAANGQWTCAGLTQNDGSTLEINFYSSVPSVSTAPFQVNGNIALTNANIAVRSTPAIGVGQYPLIKYTGSQVGALMPAMLSLPASMVAYISNNTANASIDLVVTTASIPTLFWAVGNGNWNTSEMNWKDTPVSMAANLIYQNSYPVVLDDSASGTGTILVTNLAPVSPSSVVVDVTANSYTISGNAITGTATLTKNGNSTLTLNGANTYTGNTIVNAGNLAVAGGGAINSPTATLNIGSGATLATNTLAAGGAIAVQTLLATNVNMTVANSILNLNGGTLTTSNAANALAANIQLNNANLPINSSWFMNGGTNLIGNVNTNANSSGTMTVGNNTNNVQVTVNPNAVLSFGNNGSATNPATLSIGNGTVTNNAFVINGGVVRNARVFNLGNSATSVSNLMVITNGGQFVLGTNAAFSAMNGNYNSLIVGGTNSAGVKSLLDFGGSGDRRVAVSVANMNLIWVGSGGVMSNASFQLQAGTGNRVIVTNGGQVYLAGNITVGRQGGLASYAIVGGTDAAGNNSMIAANPGSGAQLLIACSGNVGGLSTNNWVRVDQGGVVNVNNIFIGGGNGPETNNGYNSLIITNGGQVAVATNCLIGTATNSTGNWLYVGGSFGTTNSTLNLNSNSLTIGANTLTQASTNNYVKVDSNGVLANASSVILGGVNSAFYFNGGTLSSGTNCNLIATNASTVGATNWVQAGGAIIDSANFTVTNVLPLVQDPSSPGGGMTKLGVGTLVLNGVNTYTGNTVVSAGMLLGVSGGSSAGSAVTVLAGATNSVMTVAVNGQWACASLANNNGSTLDINFGLAPSATIAPLSVTGVFALTNANVSVRSMSYLGIGQYPLVKYGSYTGTLTPATFSLPDGVAGYLSNNTSNASFDLVVTATSLIPTIYWAGTNGNWDLATMNWKDTPLTAAADISYQNAWPVVLDDSASGMGTILVTNAVPVSPLSVVVNVTAKSYTISGSAITGSTTLTKNGSGTLTLNSSNTYTGNTTINAGSLVISNGGAVYSPNGVLNIGPDISKGTVTLGNGGAITVKQLLATNIILYPSNVLSVLNLSSGGFLITSNQATAIAANITVTSNAFNYLINSSWSMNGGINIVASAQTNGPSSGIIYIGSSANNVVVTVNSNAVFSNQNTLGNPTNMAVTIGSGNGRFGTTCIITNGGRIMLKKDDATNSVALNVGYSGASYSSLIVAGADVLGNKATLDCGNAPNRLYIGGNSANTTNNWVLVGTGGIITNISAYTYGGYTNGLIITNGGQIYSAGFFIGRSGVGHFGNVAGADSAGNRALVYLSSGSLSVGGINFSGPGTNNSFNVGQNGLVTNVNCIIVGADTNANGNCINITNGGQIFSKAFSRIGDYTNCNNNFITIGGTFGTTNSLWDLGVTKLAIGNDAYASNNYATLFTGGVLTNVNSIILGGINSKLNFNGGQLSVGDNGNLIDTNLTTINATNWVQVGGAIIDSIGFMVTNVLPLIEDQSSTGGGLTKLGSGTLTLLGVNTYSGPTLISAGTLALIGSASIANSPSITVACGAAFDVSGLSGFILGGSQTLSNSTVGATVNCGANGFSTASGTVSLVYDGVNPSFTVTNGTLTLSGTTMFNVNNTGAPLGTGIHKIMTSNTGSLVATAALPNVTVGGNGTVTGSASLAIISGELYLNVTAIMPSIIWPTAGLITYGQAVSNSVVSGGAATNTLNHAPVIGTFSFEVPARVPHVGTTNVNLVFTPSDLATYNSVTNFVSVPVLPAALTIAATNTTKIYGQTLPYGTGYTGFVSVGLTNGDVIDSVTLSASGGTAANAPVKTYTLTPRWAVGGTINTNDYLINYVSGTLTVNPLAIGLSGTQPYTGTNDIEGSLLTITNLLIPDSGVTLKGTALLAGTNVGTWAITDFSKLSFNGTVTNYTLAGAAGSVTIGQATGTVIFGSLNQIYDTTAKSVTAITDPTNLVVAITYNGSTNAPTNAGSYTVIGIINESNYVGSATNILVVNKASAAVTLGNLSQTYDGTARLATGRTEPTNLFINLTYDGLVNAPTNTGIYVVVGTIVDVNYQGSATNALLIGKADGTFTFGNLKQVYDGTSKVVSYSTTPTNLSVVVTYNGSVTPPTNAGSYTVIGTIDDINYQASRGHYIYKNTSSDTGYRLMFTNNQTIGQEIFPDRGQLATYPYLTSFLFEYYSPNETFSGLVQSRVQFYKNDGPPFNDYPTPGTLFYDSGWYDISTPLSLFGSLDAGLQFSVSDLYNGSPVGAVLPLSKNVEMPFDFTVVYTFQGLSGNDQVGVAVYNPPTTGTNYCDYWIKDHANNWELVTNNIFSRVGLAMEFGGTLTPSVTNVLVIEKAFATVTLSNLWQNYDGTGRSVNASTTPAGLSVLLTYNGLSALPTNDGIYTVVGTINELNYQGSATNTLIIGKAPATVILTGLNPSYDGTAKCINATTIPAGLLVDITYNGSPTCPSAIGAYQVIGTVNTTNYQGSVTNTLVIGKTPASVSLGSLLQTYDGDTKSVTVSTTPADLLVLIEYNGSPNAPTEAGSYTVIGTVVDDVYQGVVTNTLVIAKAPASVVLSNLTNTYNGAAKSATASTDPTNLVVAITYNGSTNAPTNAGTYTVIGTIEEINYQGSVTNTLLIGKATATVNLGSLVQTFDGAAKLATATTVPTNLVVVFTYNAATNAPTNAGSYAVVGAINELNYQGSATNTLVINQATATVNLSNLAQTYDGTERTVTATTTPVGVAVAVSYNGLPEAPTNAGAYTVVGSIADTNYAHFSATNTLVVRKAPATVDLGNLSHIFDGTAKAVSVSTLPAGLTVNVTYNGLIDAPTNAGAYTVVGTINELNYQGSATNTVFIGKAPASVTLDNLTQTFDGTAKAVSVSTTPSALLVDVTYNDSANAPTNVGSYAVVGTINELNYQGAATNTLVIAKANASVNLDNLVQIYDGIAKAVSISTTPIGLTVDVTYNGSTIAPTNTGSYTVIGTINELNYQGASTNTLVIGKASAAVSFGNLIQIFDGAARPATVSTTPAGLTVNVTYNGLAHVPTNAGNYTVVGTINEPNYQGSATNTLVINQAAATVNLSDLAQTYDETARTVTATTEPTGVAVTVTYDGLVNAPTNAGSYAVVGSIADNNYAAFSTTNTLVIGKATAGVVFGGLNQIYDGEAKSVTASTMPAGVAVAVTYDGLVNAPTNAGSYTVVGILNESNYQGSATNTLVIGKAPASVDLGNLTQTYNGAAKAVSVSTTPSGLTVNLTYNGSPNAPTNAGSYTVVGTINEFNYQGASTNTLLISKASASVTFTAGSLSQTYDGAAKLAAAITAPGGLAVVFTYNGLTAAPTNVGSYAVIGTINEFNYQGAATNTLVISKASAIVNIGNLTQTYDGTARSVTASTAPVGLTVGFTYNGLSTARTNAGSYTIIGTINELNYKGSATNTLVVGKAAGTVNLSNLAQTYDGAAKAISVSTTPAGLTVNVTYNGSSTAPTNVGNYTVIGTINEINYQGASTNTLVIGKAVATVNLGSLAQIYNGTAKSVSVSTTPAGLTVNVTYNGSANSPTNVGSYTVIGTVVDNNYQGVATNTLVIGKATAAVSLGSLAQAYDGTGRNATASSTPSGLAVVFTYNGSSSAPTNIGSYTVIGTINELNYQGSATNTLVISKGTAAVSLIGLAQNYDGTARSVTASTTPSGLTVNLAYNGSANAPTNVGSYTVIGTVVDTNYQGGATNTLVISKGIATVLLANLNQTYNGNSRSVTVSTVPASLSVAKTYNGSVNPPTNAGSYTVIGTVVDTNYTGSATNTLVIAKAFAGVTLGNLSQFYDGTTRNVTVSTTPLGLTVILTYNGISGAPTNLGSYTVVGAISELNYQGSATNTLVIQPVLPFVVTQPVAGQTVVVDSPASFTVTAGGTGPLVYRWKKDGTPLNDGGTISGSGTSNLTISAVSGTDAGIYSVVITNLGGSITSSNSLLNVNAQVYVVSTNGVSGGTVSVPMRLRALGREFSLQFSVGFDTSLLTFAGVDDPNVFVTTNSPIPGQVGLTFQNFAGFAPGDQLLVNLIFLVQPVTSNRVGSISFVQLPVAQQVIDSNFELLTNVVYTGGSVLVVPTEYAADVYPRPGGDYTVDLRDWGQIGRYVIGLESPTNADEMLRADCAPRNNADGLLTVADWVQAGRYAAHLDPLTVVSSGAPKMKAMAGSLSVQSKDAGQNRTIQLASLAATNGQTIIVPVSMISVGNENALGFNVTFDPAKLTFRGAAKGAAANATQFNVNSNQVASGRLGIALSLSSGSVFPAGSNQLALLSFGVKNTARGKTPVTFVATNPVVEQVCDSTAGVLSANYNSGEITLPPEAPMLQLQLQVGNGSLMLSWPQIYSNYYVQSIENLTSGIWNSNLGSPSVSGTNLQIILPATNPAQFFRLSQ